MTQFFGYGEIGVQKANVLGYVIRELSVDILPELLIKLSSWDHQIYKRTFDWLDDVYYDFGYDEYDHHGFFFLFKKQIKLWESHALDDNQSLTRCLVEFSKNDIEVFMYLFGEFVVGLDKQEMEGVILNNSGLNGFISQRKSRKYLFVIPSGKKQLRIRSIFWMMMNALVNRLDQAKHLPKHRKIEIFKAIESILDQLREQEFFNDASCHLLSSKLYFLLSQGEERWFEDGKTVPVIIQKVSNWNDELISWGWSFLESSLKEKQRISGSLELQVQLLAVCSLSDFSSLSSSSIKTAARILQDEFLDEEVSWLLEWNDQENELSNDKKMVIQLLKQYFKSNLSPNRKEEYITQSIIKVEDDSWKEKLFKTFLS